MTKQEMTKQEMTKQEKFLWLVQTSILANAISLASVPKYADKWRHVISLTGVFGIMSDAIYASERIPNEMDVSKAANEFVTFALDNIREIEEKAHGQQLECPVWFTRY